MRYRVLIVTLLLMTGLGLAASSPVDIFRLDMDNPGHGFFGGSGVAVSGGHVAVGIGVVPNAYTGTVWSESHAAHELQNVRMRIDFEDRVRMTEYGHVDYKLGTVEPAQIVSQNFRFLSPTDVYLTPRVTIEYVLDGQPGKATRYSW